MCSAADMAATHDHNSSPMSGVAYNPDPALAISQEHEHQHVHHSARAAHADNIVYTSGTTDDRSTVPTPSAQDSHLHHSHQPDKNHDIEKAGGYDYEVEKATHSSGEQERETETKAWYSPSVLYRKYRLPIHLLIASKFTG